VSSFICTSCVCQSCVVSSTRYHHRTHQARPSSAQRPSRAHEPHRQQGSDSSAAAINWRIMIAAMPRLVSYKTEPPYEARATQCIAPNSAELTASLRPVPHTALSVPQLRRSRHRLRPPLRGPKEPVKARIREATALGSPASCTLISDGSMWRYEEAAPLQPFGTRLSSMSQVLLLTSQGRTVRKWRRGRDSPPRVRNSPVDTSLAVFLGVP
jgi:hypothetical protein